MDQYPTTKIIVKDELGMYFIKQLKKIFFLAIFLIVFTLFAPRINSTAKNSFTHDLYDKINMEEMKIRGKIDKPNIMYIIPRSKLQVDMIVSDEYLFPSLFNSCNPENQIIIDESIASEKLLLESISKSLSHANTQEVKNGSCVSCHYFEMTLPEKHTSQKLTQELNQLCINCHPTHYYHICWEEIEKMIFYFDKQAIPSTLVSSYPHDIFFTTIVCKKCHPAWMKPKRGPYRKRKKQIGDKEYDSDQFCKICHRSYVY